MGQNKAMPFYDSSPGVQKVVSQFSIGELATDLNGNTTSAIDEINYVADKVTPTFTPLSPTASTSVSAIVGLYRQYATGTSLYTGGSATDYSLGALVGSQVLAFHITAKPETWSKYHTKKNGSIVFTFDEYQTAEQYSSSWQFGGGRLGEIQVEVVGISKTTINPFAASAMSSDITVASSLHGPYTHDVVVTDVISGLTLTTSVSTSYSIFNITNTYHRIPYQQKINTGSWASDNNKTTYVAARPNG